MSANSRRKPTVSLFTGPLVTYRSVFLGEEMALVMLQLAPFPELLPGVAVVDAGQAVDAGAHVVAAVLQLRHRLDLFALRPAEDVLHTCQRPGGQG